MDADPAGALGRVVHIGIVVPDIELAREEIGAALGVTWGPIAQNDVAARSANAEHRARVLLTWSRQGPPHLELLQGPEGTPWGAGGARRLHHVGYWADDVAATAERLARTGMTVELAGVDEEGNGPAGFAYLATGALRVEVLDARRRVLLERWLAGA